MAWLVQIPTASQVKSYIVESFSTVWSLQGFGGELVQTHVPGAWNYPFHPQALQSDVLWGTQWGARRHMSTLVEDSVRDGQQTVLDPVGHQAVDNLVHYKRWTAGVMSLVGPMQRLLHLDFPVLADDTRLEFFTKTTDGNDVVYGNNWLNMEFGASAESMSPLVEDAHVLYEYSDLLPLGGFDREEAQTAAPYGQKPMLLYGHGTFVTPVRSLRQGEAPDALEFGRLQVPQVFDDEDAASAHIQWVDKTTTARPNPGVADSAYDPVVSWTVLPAASGSDASGDAFVCLHRSGRLTVALGMNVDKHSLDLVSKGRLKFVVGADDAGKSLLLSTAGDVELRVGDDMDYTTTKISASQIETRVYEGGVAKTRYKQDALEVDINNGALVVDV
jgi:hypothetical protein